MSPKTETMHYYTLNLTYIRPLTEVEAVLDARSRYFESPYQRGAFLLSGRKDPWTGGSFSLRRQAETILSASSRKIPSSPRRSRRTSSFHSVPREQALIWHQWVRKHPVDKHVFTQEGRVRMSD
jgi:uncharacterized protein YciI